MVSMDVAVDPSSVTKSQRITVEDGNFSFTGEVTETGSFGSVHSVTIVDDDGKQHSFEFLGEEDDPKIVSHLT